MLGMIAAGKARQVGIAVPAELGFQAGFGFVVGIDGHVLDQREKFAERRIRIKA